MYNIKDYFDKDNHICRMKIARDIKSLKLTKEDLDELVKNENVKSVFIGRNFKRESDKEKWTKEYFGDLYYMAIAESFNEDYLFHLYEVAEHGNQPVNQPVNPPTENSKLIGIILIFATIAAFGTAIYSWINNIKECTGDDCPVQTANLIGAFIHNWINTKIGS